MKFRRSASDNDRVNEAAEHYFSSRPQAADKPRTVEFTVAGQRFQLAASAGVFSADRLDPGTAVLLRKAELPSGDGTFLDLGCGYGPITAVLARATTGTVYALDTNLRALDLVRANATALDVADRVRPVTADQVPDDARFDQIWSNPPIRIGKDALHDLLSVWLPRLRPGGTAWLVVARHKGADSLADWLTGRGFATRKFASQKGYRVLTVSAASDS